MGGYGSTRWGGHRKRRTVESALTLDVGRFVHEGIIGPDVWRSGSWQWTYADGDKARISYEVNTAGPSWWARLHYTIGGTQDLDYKVTLAQTRQHFGGMRWWWRCPQCHRRARKLYLPSRATRFLCRGCHDLAYRSSQEHDKGIDRLERLLVAGDLTQDAVTATIMADPIRALKLMDRYR
jgi:hypothetical protein